MPVSAGALTPVKRPIGLWVGLAVLVLLGLTLGGVGLLFARNQADSGVLRAQGTAPDPGLLRVQGGSDAGVTQVQVDPKVEVTMPEDIRRWLEHLERTEKQRIEITKTQLPQLMTRAMRAKMSGAMEMLKSMAGADDPTAPDVPPNQDFAAETAQFQAAWRQLVDQFNSYPPPAECIPIRDNYDQALRETGAMIGDVFKLLNDSATNPDAAIASLSRMQGTSAERIDVAAKNADRGVAEICDKYNTRKWFDVAGDIGNSGLLNTFTAP